MTPAVAYTLYLLFALGGVGLYLAMPRPEGSRARSGALIGVCAIVGLMVLLGLRMLAGESLAVFFYVFAGVAVLAAGRVVTHPKPVYSAVYFGLVILCVAMLLVVQQAEFLAVALVIIYAGAILVVYAFVIMLARQSGESVADIKAREPALAVFVAFVAAAAVTVRIAELPGDTRQPGEQETVLVSTADTRTTEADEPAAAQSGNTIEVGRRMFGPFVVTVELAGVLLLVAMVGAVAMVRKHVPVEEVGPPPPPPGKIGREVPPY